MPVCIYHSAESTPNWAAGTLSRGNGANRWPARPRAAGVLCIRANPGPQGLHRVRIWVQWCTWVETRARKGESCKNGCESRSCGQEVPNGAHMDKSGLKTHNITGAAQEPGPVWTRAARKTQTGSLKAIMTFGRLKFRWGRLDAVHACTSRPPWKAEPPERLVKDDQKPAACCTWEERGCHEPLAPRCSKSLFSRGARTRPDILPRRPGRSH